MSPRGGDMVPTLTDDRELAQAFREIRKGFPYVPAHVALSWARTRMEILRYVGADYDVDGNYCMTVDLPDLPTVYVYGEPDIDDCAFGDGCEYHEHQTMFARIPARADRTVVDSIGAVCCTGGADEY